MPNMSHCRFENTHGDLLDCRDAFQALKNGDKEAELSPSEHQHAIELLEAAFEMLEDVSNSFAVPFEDLDIEFFEMYVNNLNSKGE